MSEQERLDRPELREKIGELLAKNAGFFDSRGWNALPPSVQKVCGEEADQILALIEEGQHKLCEVCKHVAIEEAKKQERERILNLVNSYLNEKLGYDYSGLRPDEILEIGKP